MGYTAMTKPGNLVTLDEDTNPILRFFYSYGHPITQMIVDWKNNSDFMGTPLNSPAKWGIWFLRSTFVPASLSDLIPLPGTVDTTPEERWGQSILQEFGIAATHVSPSVLREEALDKAAGTEYGVPGRELQPYQRTLLVEKHPDIATLADQAQAMSAERGYASAKFWTQVDTQRKPLEEQIENAGRMFRNKEISGNRYRAMVQSAEAQMGQFVRQLRDSNPEFKDVLLAGEFPHHVEPSDVQRFINQWYAIYGVSVQSGTTGDLDFRKVNTLRDLLLFKYKAKPEVVKEGMAYINRKKLAAT
jgi:hypothetical protein